MKRYFSDMDSERCYPMSFFKEMMRDNGIYELELRLAIIDTGAAYFFCNEHGEVGEVGSCAGCPDYKALNGKNGKCYHYRNCYTASEETITIKRKTPWT